MTTIIYTTTQTAHYFGVTERTIQRWAHAGTLKPAPGSTFGPGNRLIFRASECRRVKAKMERDLDTTDALQETP